MYFEYILLGYKFLFFVIIFHLEPDSINFFIKQKIFKYMYNINVLALTNTSVCHATRTIRTNIVEC